MVYYIMISFSYVKLWQKRGLLRLAKEQILFSKAIGNVELIHDFFSQTLVHVWQPHRVIFNVFPTFNGCTKCDMYIRTLQSLYILLLFKKFGNARLGESN